MFPTFLVLLLLPPVFSDCFCSQYDIFADCGGTEAGPIIFILPWFPVLSLGDFHQYLEFFIHGLAISVFCDEIETELERIVLPLRQSLFFSSGCRTINFPYWRLQKKKYGKFHAKIVLFRFNLRFGTLKKNKQHVLYISQFQQFNFFWSIRSPSSCPRLHFLVLFPLLVRMTSRVSLFPEEMWHNFNANGIIVNLVIKYNVLEWSASSW